MYQCGLKFVISEKLRRLRLSWYFYWWKADVRFWRKHNLTNDFIPLDIKKWQDYTEPGDELDPGSPLRRTSRNLDDDTAESLPLPEGVLITNLGLDIVVVITKTDYMSTLEKEQDYKWAKHFHWCKILILILPILTIKSSNRDEHFDFMQQWIRRFCLQYGAGLFYTSAKEDKNCDLLYKYLTHRIYSLPFRTPALVVEKDAVLM